MKHVIYPDELATIKGLIQDTEDAVDEPGNDWTEAQKARIRRNMAAVAAALKTVQRTEAVE